MFSLNTLPASIEEVDLSYLSTVDKHTCVLYIVSLLLNNYNESVKL